MRCPFVNAVVERIAKFPFGMRCGAGAWLAQKRFLAVKIHAT